MDIHYDIWFDHEGKAFDSNCFKILKAVEQTGSLNKAAVQIDMSYVCALKTLRLSEERLGFTLLDRKTGGRGGGGSRLTSEAREFMTRYRSFTDEISKSVRHIQEKHLGPGTT